MNASPSASILHRGIRLGLITTRLVALGISLFTALSACNGIPTATPAPAPAPTPVPATVQRLLDDAEVYSGRTISMTGTVILECTNGCWFFLDDGTGKIYIDLAVAGLHIPQKVGSRVTLIGRTSGSGGQLRIEAEEVSFPE